MHAIFDDARKRAISRAISSGRTLPSPARPASKAQAELPEPATEPPATGDQNRAASQAALMYQTGMLLQAINKGDPGMAADAITNGASATGILPCNPPMIPLCLASSIGDARMMGLLASLGAPVDGIDWFGYAAVHWAVRSNKPQSIIWLHENGANISVHDDTWRYDGWEGMTPLHLALKNNNSGMVRLLLSLGADVDAPIQNRCGRGNRMTPLILAILEDS